MQSEYPRQFIASLYHHLLGPDTRPSPLRTKLVKQLLPYCLVRKGDAFLPLNREYKPLGWPTQKRCHLDYQSGEYDSMLLRVDARRLSSLTHVDNTEGDFFYLYGGPLGDPPWRDRHAALAYELRLRDVLNIPGRIGEDGCYDIAA